MRMKFNVICGTAAIIYLILKIGRLDSLSLDKPSFTACDILDDIGRLSDNKFGTIGITDLIDELTKIRSNVIAVNSSTSVIRKVGKIRDHVYSLVYAISNFKRKQPNLAQFVSYPYVIRSSADAERALKNYLKNLSLLYSRTMSRLTLDGLSSKELTVIKAELARNSKKSMRIAKKSATKEQNVILKEVMETFKTLNKDLIAVRRYKRLITHDFERLAREPLYPYLKCPGTSNDECNCGTRGICTGIPGLFTFCDCRINSFGKGCMHTYLASGWPKCRAYVDVHYVTYDGAKFDFQGKCLYLLSKAEVSGRIWWEVFQQNWMKPGGSSRVSYPKAMYLRVHERAVYGIHQNRNGNPHITLDGTRIGTGDRKFVHNAIDVDINIIQDGDFTIITVEKNGVQIAFDGDMDSYVKISTTLAEEPSVNIQGMCGNANGNSVDDYKTRGGRDVQFNSNRGSLIGNSFQENNRIDPSITMACRLNASLDTPMIKEIFLGLTRRYCDYSLSHCKRNITGFELNACMVDAYHAVSLQDVCTVLKKEVFLQYECADEIFDCRAIIARAHSIEGLKTFPLDWKYPLANKTIRYGY